MKQLMSYLQFFNKKILNQNQNSSEINLKTKLIHYRRDLDSLG